MTSVDPRYYYLTLGLLVLCTIVGMIVAFRFQREVEHDLSPTTEKDLLGPLEKAFYSGLMDEAEFRRIRASMERRKGEAAGPRQPKKVEPRRPEASQGSPPPEVEPEADPAEG